MDETKDLIQIIRDNPGCVAFIDNDNWWIERGDTPPSDFDKWDDGAQDDWWESQIIVRSRDEIVMNTDNFGTRP